MNATQTIDPRLGVAFASVFAVGAVVSLAMGSLAGAAFGWVLATIISYRAWTDKKRQQNP